MAEKIGILGDGQLARMLGEAAISKGLEPLFYSNKAQSPVSELSGEIFSSPDEVLEKSQRAIIESEFLDLSRLKNKSIVFPKWEVLEQFSDKLVQKEILTRLGLPTLPYQVLQNVSELEAIEAPKVLKTARLGYDGYGNFVMRSPGDLKEAREFFLNAQKRELRVFAEDFADFDQELALVSTAGSGGELACFPLVETYQNGGVCRWVRFRQDLANEYTQSAREIACKLSKSTGLLGSFAIEFFVVNSQLVVNEIAPRVHNSGHFSMDASDHSQFDLHLRACLGESLSTSVKAKYFGMWNLLGKAGAILQRLEGIKCPKNSSFYWYGKSEVRAGRKMGHLNLWADTKKEFEEVWAQSKEWIENFWQT